MIEIERLLEKIGFINKKHREIDRITGNRFNLFQTLGIESKEVKLHSKFMGELLNPQGSHGNGDVFLAEFIEQLRLYNIKSDFRVSTKSQIKVEVYIGKILEDKGGIVDILLVDELGNHIAIENKIYAGDQDKQLLRYSNIDNKKALLLYLTLDGREPSQESIMGLVSEQDFYCVSYRDLIVNWIEKCYHISIERPRLREILKQYLETIKNLTGMSNAKHEETLEIFNAVGHNESTATASLNLIQNWEHIKYHTEWTFWDELIKVLSEKSGRTIEKDFTDEWLSQVIRTKKQAYISVHTLFYDDHKDYQIYFSICRDNKGSNIYYGLNVMLKNEADEVYVNMRLKPENPDFFDETESETIWSYWRYFQSHQINFADFNNAETVKLANNIYRQKLISNLVEEVLDYMSNFQEPFLFEERKFFSKEE